MNLKGLLWVAGSMRHKLPKLLKHGRGERGERREAGRGGARRGEAGRCGAGRGGAGPNWLHSVPLHERDDCIFGTSVSQKQNNSLNIPLEAQTKRIPGHSWNDKSLQKQKCVDLLVGVQDEVRFSSR